MTLPSGTLEESREGKVQGAYVKTLELHSSHNLRTTFHKNYDNDSKN